MEVEPASVDEGLPDPQTQASQDFSAVRGFQVAGAGDQAAAQGAGGQEAWRQALTLELEARAARFHQAVDAAIVLSNDALIRWLGDPVARLTPGPNALTPGTVVLADPAMPAASLETAKNRVDLWLAAATRRLLGPLFALEAMQEGSQAVRDLAGALSRSFGILEREAIRRQVKALAQNERAELRKHGVRFGAYYVFVPTLIKPAPRTLALQLSSLAASGDCDAVLRELGPVAASGRTSLPFDGRFSADNYRVAGYRPCGDRIVRIDVVERLAGIIRAAMVNGPAEVGAGQPPPLRNSNGFLVSGQMTSLTGCAGEQFISILRSMGFQRVEMTRAQFYGSSPPAQAPPEPKPLEDMEIPGLTAVDDAADGHDAKDDEGTLVVGEKGESADPVLTAPAASSSSPLDAPSPNASGSPSVGGASKSADVAADADVLVVWRPEVNAFSRREKRKVRPNKSRPAQGRRSRFETLAVPAQNSNPGPEMAPPSLVLAQAPETITRAPPGPDRSEKFRSNEKHRQTGGNRDMPRPPQAPRQEPRAKPDPNSPFAKLLELRTLLERQANKRP